MNISNYYWYFKGVLTPKFCDEVIKYGLSQAESMARTVVMVIENLPNKK